jgi:DNA polymerase-4
MDAFYASVEQHDFPELKGKCVIVGGHLRRGVVSAASYEARQFGVRSAMPIFQAKEKCPQGIYVPPRMGRYKEISKKIMALLSEFSPLVEPVSIDEAYMDISGCDKLFGSPEQMARRIKTSILEAVDLTCSIGVAPNRFLAKIASDLKKPDGLTVIHPHEAFDFCQTLAIEKIPGVGKKTNRHLTAMGIQTLGDVRQLSSRFLTEKLGKYGDRLKKLSKCVDETPVSVVGLHKSVSSEETLSIDVMKKNEVRRYLLKHAEDVGRQLRRMGAMAKIVTMKIKHSNFKQYTRRKTLDRPTSSSDTIYLAAVSLLDEYPVVTSIRLVGVAASGLDFDQKPRQLALFEEEDEREFNWEKVDRVIDSIEDKFGKDVIKKAALHGAHQKPPSSQ